MAFWDDGQDEFQTTKCSKHYCRRRAVFNRKKCEHCLRLDAEASARARARRGPRLLKGLRRGEAHASAKLNEAKVAELRTLALLLGRVRGRNGVLAKRYKVSSSMVSRIINRLAWTHVE
jgi:hypothetical protein